MEQTHWFRGGLPSSQNKLWRRWTRSLATLDEQIDKAVIRAPFSGVLDRVFVNVGEMASAPMPVVRVVDLSDLYVRASVSDHYAGVVEVGPKVTVEAQGLEPIESQIRRVGQFIEAANRTIDLTIDLPEGTRALPNMVATVHITDVALDSALALPSAVVQQDANGQEYVYVMQRPTKRRNKRFRRDDVGGSIVDRKRPESRRQASSTEARRGWWKAKK